ncbi:glycosyltransferase family 2 protein [Candidatus Gottesmanbacteria bacterium]|nr:glycosyltransferase family 2 protein [Candidatus Gottesmanbacteria bacterium]
MKVSIVIPNYNGEALLKKNLPKVLEAVEGEEVIVVDDASTDGSIEEIKNAKLKMQNYNAKLKIIENRKNFGFASTVNRGVEEAKGELVVLLNTDVVPDVGFLETVLPHFKDSKVFAVGFLQKCPENGKVILRGRGVGKFEKGFLVHSRGVVSDKDTSAREHPRGVPQAQHHPWGGGIAEVEDFRKTLWVSGGAGIFRKSIWEKLGGLDTLYNPFYWEDIDLSYRALKAGYKLIFEPKSIVEHQQETTIKSQYSQGKIKTIAYRNQILFVWLNITDFRYLFEHFLYFPYHILKSVVTFDWTFLKGFMMAVLLSPKVLVHRNRNAKLSRISDRLIFLV